MQGGTRCYLPISSQPATWLAARMRCFTLDSDLISINTLQERVFVDSIMEVRHRLLDIPGATLTDVHVPRMCGSSSANTIIFKIYQVTV